MAIDFDGSADYLSYDGASIDETAQLSFSIRFKPDDVTSIQRVAQFRDGNAGFMVVLYQGWLYFSGSSGSGNYGANTSTRLRVSASTGIPYTICGTVAAGSTTKNVDSAYVNGSALSNTGISGAAGWTGGSDTDTLHIGARTDATSFYDGIAAEICVWEGYQLTAEDASALAAGVPAYLINPGAIKIYDPLFVIGASKSLVGEVARSETSLITNAEHPPIVSVGQIVHIGEAAGGGGTILPLLNAYHG